MKNYLFRLLLISLTLLFMPGCSVIAGIFAAGFWVAILILVIIVALVFLGFKKLGKR